MAVRNDSFSPGIWYHCYNSTIDNRTAFESTGDYQRFLEILYLANNADTVRRAKLGHMSFGEILRIPRGPQLVSIAAFSILPSTFHLVLRESEPGGITAFMRKAGTAYAMYFNDRYTRSGNLFLRPFRSREVSETRLGSLVSYVHASPASLYEPEWRTRHIVDSQYLGERLAAYPYSSLKAYSGARSPYGPILDSAGLAKPHQVPTERLLKEALAYIEHSGGVV